LGWFPTAPVLFFGQRTNDRPAGPYQPSIPVDYSIRSDFAAAWDAAVSAVHDFGATLPVASPARYLPAARTTTVPPADLMPFIGRTVGLVPSLALNDPATDPLALGHVGATPLEVVAKQLDATAPKASQVQSQQWKLYTCNATSCQESPPTAGIYVKLTPILNAAGWYQGTPVAPQTLAKPGSWARWTNTTGLIANVTTLGDELSLLYADAEIAASALRERVAYVWNGTDFVAPGP
jgi:hypothetical protein